MSQIDLRSDTVTRPCEEMKKAMYRAEVGDDGYGDDPTVKMLQNKVAAMFDKEAALFVPSGTMSNQICLRLLASQGDEVVCDSQAHIYRKECAAASALWGISFLPLSTPRGILSVEQIVSALPSKKINHPNVKVIALENTTVKGSGAFYRLAELEAIWQEARRLNLAVHIDGARLFNGCQAGGYSPAQAARCCDTVVFCLSKGLGAPVGSMIVSSRDNIDKAIRLRKMLGGTMRQAGSLAAAGIFALEHNRARLAEDHARANRLAEGLSGIPGIEIDPALIDTNIVTFDISPLNIAVETFVQQAMESGVLLKSCGFSGIRAVTHLDVNDQDISRAIAVIGRIAKG
ncbi:threonine aldolase family protein [Desulforhopalus singaporensis]|nr:low specificity L-threonine aldolase [Desulforhopalus singaporensis]